MKHKANKQGRGQAHPYDRSNAGEEFDVQNEQEQNRNRQQEPTDESQNQEMQQEGEGRESQEGIGPLAKQARNMAKNMDTETIAKYAAVGLLVFAAMRKSGFLGGLLVSVAAGVVTRYMLEPKASSDENEQYEQEGGSEEEQDLQMGQG